MELVWTRIVEAVRSTVATVLPLLVTWWQGLGPWRLAVLALVALLLLWGLVAGRRRRPRRRAAPELLLSRGEIRLLGLADAPPVALPHDADGAPHDRFGLSLTLANLGSEPVQLLEIAIRTELADAPALLERDALIPPRRSAVIEGEVAGLAGDRGRIEVYVYAGRGAAPGRFGGARRGSYRLRARLTWDPWRERYRVDPLEQRVSSARALPSSRLAARDRDAWRQRQQQLAQRNALLDENGTRIAVVPIGRAAGPVADPGSDVADLPFRADAAPARRSSPAAPLDRVDLRRFGAGLAGGFGSRLAGAPGSAAAERPTRPVRLGAGPEAEAAADPSPSVLDDAQPAGSAAAPDERDERGERVGRDGHGGHDERDRTASGAARAAPPAGGDDDGDAGGGADEDAGERAGKGERPASRRDRLEFPDDF